MAGIRDVKKFSAPSVDLGGRVRTIQFDLNAFGELENRFGTIQKAMEQLQKGRMNDIRTILWAGLIHDEVILDDVTGEPKGYKITPYDVGGWVNNPQMMQQVSEKLGLALAGDMPDPEHITSVANVPTEAIGQPALPVGVKMAAVVPTEEEQALETKNG